MSGKYDNVVKLLTPISTLENAGLLFKMTYEMKDGNFVPRLNDNPTKNNFYSGKGPGWISQDRDDNYTDIIDYINEKTRLCMEHLYIDTTYPDTVIGRAAFGAERVQINLLIAAGRPTTPYNPVRLVVPRDSALKPSGPPPDGMNYYPRDLAVIEGDINNKQNQINSWLDANPNKKLILDLASTIIYELRDEIIQDPRDSMAGEKNIARGVLELQKDLTANRALLNLLNTIFTFRDGAGNPINILLNGSIKEDMINTIGTGAATLEVAIKDPNLPMNIFSSVLPVNGELLYSNDIRTFGRVPATGTIGPVNLLLAYNDAVAAHRGRLFSWNFGQYMARKGMNMKKPQGTNAWSSLIENVIGPKYDEIVGRDGENRFTIKKDDGTTELLEKFSKSQSTCNQSGQTGTAAGSDTDCFNRIMNCTLSINNTDGSAVALVDGQCMTALEEDNVWKVTKDRIRALNTPMIVDLLKKIGMKAYTQSVTGKNILESYEDWKKKVDDNNLIKNDGSVYVIPAAVHNRAKALAAKGQFKDFINALIGYVNSNSLILNPKSKDDKKTKTDKFGISPAYGNNKLEPFRNLINSARNSIFSIHSAIGSRFVNLNGINVTPAYQLIGFTGGDQEGGFLSGAMSTRKIEVPKFAKQLRSIYEHYVSRLATLNKKLSPATEQSVEAVFTNLEDVEKKLSQWIDYLYKYTEVMRIENNYDKDNFVGAVELKDAFEKYERLLSKFSRRSVNMIDILSTIANATDTESSKTRTVPLRL